MKTLIHVAVVSLSAISLVASDARAGGSGCTNQGTQTIAGSGHGINDVFSPECIEPTDPSAGLLQYASLGSSASFDSTWLTQTVAHTMKGFSKNIDSAILTFRAKPMTNSAGDDTIELRFIDPDDGTEETVYHWKYHFETIGWGSGTTQLGIAAGPWEPSYYPDGELFALDLCKLPSDWVSGGPNMANDLIPYLDEHGRLDIVVSSNTAVDFVSLEITHCNGGIVDAIAMPPCGSELSPQLVGSIYTDPNDMSSLTVGVEHGQPYHTAALFVGLGTGSAPVGYGATLDILPLIGGALMLPLDQEGEFELTTPLPPAASGANINLQTVMVNPGTGELRSSNGLALTLP